MFKKIQSWVARYGPAEISGVASGIIGASISYYLSESLIISAFVGAMSENIGFYGWMIGQEALQSYKKNGKFSWQQSLTILRNLFVEFGFSEILDSFMIRPFCMYWGPVLIAPYALGIFAGSMAANVTFYSLSITGYELRKKHFKD